MDPIKDSGAAVKLLKNEGKKITFVTNNSIRSEKGYLEQFKQAGIETDIVSIKQNSVGNKQINKDQVVNEV